MAQLVQISKRAGILVEGPDAAKFLQGLITQDIHAVQPNRPAYSAFLTPQGKYLFDFFIYAQAGGYVLEMTELQAPALLTKLRPYQLRAKVELTLIPELAVAVDLTASDQPDPRDVRMGSRYLQAGGAQAMNEYQQRRVELGIPETVDLVPEQSLIMEYGFERLNAISWTKGCYLGQELTARMKYRALVKRELRVLHLVEGVIATDDTELDYGLRLSYSGTCALALVKIDARVVLTSKNGAVFSSASVPDRL